MSADAERRAEGRSDHRRAWMIAFGLGIVVIVVCHVLETGPWWPATLLPGVMLIHIISAHRNRHVSPDTKGDGVYYLGFLFTFAAMLSALLGLAPGEGDDVAIIRNFGIALVTTILGLAGRVWFAMSKESSGDEAKTEVERLVNEVANVRTQIGAVRARLEAHVDLLADFGDEFAEGTRSVLATIERTAEEGGAVAEDLASVAGKTRDLAKKTEAGIEADMDAMADASGSVADSFVRLSRRLNSYRDDLPEFGDTARDVVKTLAEVAEASRGVTRQMEEVTATVGERMRTMADARSSLRELNDGVERATRALSGALESLETDISALRGDMAEARVPIRSLAVAGADMREAVADAGTVQLELRRFTEAVSESRQALQVLVATYENDLPQLRDASSQALGTLAGVTTAGRTVSQALDRELRGIEGRVAAAPRVPQGRGVDPAGDWQRGFVAWLRRLFRLSQRS